jgi:Ca2+-binding RTX toxin-like protein
LPPKITRFIYPIISWQITIVNTIIAGNYSDTINSGEGNDTINLGFGHDSVDGGAGIDTLIIDYSANDNTGNNTKGIRYLNGAVGVYIAAYKGTDNEYDRISYSGIEQFNITGTKYDDEMRGGSGNDTLKGESGNDYLDSGAGNDKFTFSGGTLGASTITSLLGNDTITDFTSGQDKIVLSKATFGVITGTAIGANFATVANDDAAKLSSAAIVYSESTRSLFYNENVATAGLGTHGGSFATLTGISSLAAGDFTLI